MPTRIVAAGGLAALDFTGAAAHVRVGDATSEPVEFSSEGVALGKRGRAPWSPAAVDALLASVEADLQKARGMLLLRTTLHTAYPVAARRAAQPPSPALAAVLARDAPSLGAAAGAHCGAPATRESLARTVATTVDAWRTAERTAESCTPGRNGERCAPTDAGIDAAIATVVALAAEVGQRVAVCAQAPIGLWPSPWDLASLDLDAVPLQPAHAFTALDQEAARRLLAPFHGALWPSARCLLETRWALVPLEWPLRRRNGTTLQSYAVRVVLPYACAQHMVDSGLRTEHRPAWPAALALLAGLSAEFAAFAAPLGVAPELRARAAVARSGAPTAVCAALKLAFAMLVAHFGEGVGSQIAMRMPGDDASERALSLEHASFGVAMIAFAMRNPGGGEPIPPIVVDPVRTETAAGAPRSMS